MMERQIGHMVRLIDDLLDVSRISSGKIRLRRQLTPLTTLVQNAVEISRAAAAAKNITLTVLLPEQACVLDVDPTRFVQILSNLLHNATKFTPSGGMIRVAGSIRNTGRRRRPRVKLSVADSGVGIASPLLPRVFDLFTQGHSESSQPGLGIGLALARQLVEMHGGRITARSDGEGQGSEFVVELTCRTDAAVQPDQPTSSPGLTGPARRIEGRRVFVIDDNEDAANATAMLVQALGGESRVAHNAERGLDEVLAYRPDAVLLDIGLPGIDGYAACRRSRRELGDQVLLVALTGFGQPHDKEMATRAGFNAHVTKPAAPAVLATVLAATAGLKPPEGGATA
jgi:CheY-like chemotaxis protein